MDSPLRDMKYSEEQIKKAFWMTFHKSGEQWFNYLGTDEENEASTNSYWEDFIDELETPSDTFRDL